MCLPTVCLAITRAKTAAASVSVLAHSKKKLVNIFPHFVSGEIYFPNHAKRNIFPKLGNIFSKKWEVYLKKVWFLGKYSFG